MAAPTPPRPLCFVLMPFGRKPDRDRPDKPEIDFDAIYRDAIAPAIADAGLQPIRADQEQTIGFIHKPMFERLLLCDFAVADLTTANANVLYELGVRHASRQNTTLPIFAEQTKLPFDVAFLRAIPYRLTDTNELGPEVASKLRKDLGDRLRILRDLARKGDPGDSPVRELLSGVQQSSLPRDERLRRVSQADPSLFELLNRYAGHAKTDIFREMVAYSEECKEELRRARIMDNPADAVAALNAIRSRLSMDTVEAGVLVDLFLSYRAVQAWDEMVSLYEQMPLSIRRSVLVREQLAFALNRRAGKDPATADARHKAIELLDQVISEIGVNPETCGIKGRVYKDLWQGALGAGRKAEAAGYLRKAIDTYAAGFLADWRDAYPGVNAVTLLDIEGGARSLARKNALLPAVRFAVEQKIARGADYWDYATLVELDVLDNRADTARERLEDALAAVRESWEPKTTADNLTYIGDARAGRGEDVARLREIVQTLRARAGQ